MSEDEQAPVPSASEEESSQAQKADGDAHLKELLDEAVREKEQFRAMAQRAQADLVNYRHRAAEEREEVRRAATSQLLLKILSVVDDLERALSLIPQDAVAPGWYGGLKLVLRNIHQVLESEGVSKIDAVGQEFGPWEFEAVQHQETAETEEGKVIMVLREGYKHRDKVLRAAQVVVAKRPEPTTEAKPSKPSEEEDRQCQK